MTLRAAFRNLTALLVIMGLLYAVSPFNHSYALSDFLPNRYFKLSDNRAAKLLVNYEMGFDTTIVGSLGSVEFEICENDPFPGTSCSVPTGFDISGATLISQSGTNDFTIDVPQTNAHKIVFSRTASVVPVTTFRFELSGVKNPDNTGAEYARIRTFTAASAGGSIVESAGLAFNIIGDLSISTEVPPHIDLCVGVIITNIDCTDVQGNSIDLGILKDTVTSSATSQIVSGTNADNGYTVTVSGTSLTSGNNVITPLTSLTPATAGINQFGLNLRQNIAPAKGAEPAGIGSATPVGNYNIPDNYMFVNGDTIISASGPDNLRRFTATYITNIDKNQPAGVYATTITYIALGNF